MSQMRVPYAIPEPQPIPTICIDQRAFDGYYAAVEEVEKLRTENTRLREANKLLDDALMEASPYGAAGKVFDLWNAARAALGEK